MARYQQVVVQTVEAHQWNGVKVEEDAPEWLKQMVRSSYLRMTPYTQELIRVAGYDIASASRIAVGDKEFGVFRLMIEGEGNTVAGNEPSVGDIMPGDYLLWNDMKLRRMDAASFEMTYQPVSKEGGDNA